VSEDVAFVVNLVVVTLGLLSIVIALYVLWNMRR